MDKYHGLSAFVDAPSLLRGVAYAAENRVALISASDVDAAQGEISANVDGREEYPYELRIEYSIDNRVITAFSGICSCPVGINCKHCVATIFVALEFLPGGLRQKAFDKADEDEQLTADEYYALANAASSRWFYELRSILPVTDDDPQPLGIGLELREPGRRRGVYYYGPDLGALDAYPLRMGKRDWVKTGISFTQIRTGAATSFLLSHRKAIRELVQLDEGSRIYASNNGAINLQRLGSALTWRVLRSMVDEGVELISLPDKSPVIWHDEPGWTRIAVSGFGGSITLESLLGHDSAASAARFVTIGQPAQGIAWQDALGLHLAPLDPVATDEWDRLYRTSDVLEIPASGKEKFDEEFFPALAAHNELEIHGTYTVPELPKADLVLRLDRAGTVEQPVARAAWSWQYPPGTRVQDPKHEREMTDRALGIVGTYLPALSDGGVLRSGVLIHGEDLLQIGAMRDELRAAGITVFTDVPDYIRGGELTIDLTVTSDKRDWLDLGLVMKVGDLQVPIVTIIESLTRGEKFAYVGELYVSLEGPEFDKLGVLLAEALAMTDRRKKGISVPRARLSWWDELFELDAVRTDGGSWIERIRSGIAALESADDIPIPAGLHASLRPYQRDGFQWLSRLRDAGFGGVLADDMGLGKTLQILAMILRDVEEHVPQSRTERAFGQGWFGGDAPRGDGPWLVVAPTSVVSNWVNEAEKFAPSLNVVGVYATEKKLKTTLAREVAGADVVVTSYTLLRMDADRYRDLGVRGLVLDEAQNVKNALSRAFAAAMELGAPTTYAVTGTPIENNLGELWAMFALAVPGLLGSGRHFREAFALPIERGISGGDSDKGANEDTAREHMARLRRRIAPFILRRTKDSVALDLPPKQEQVLPVQLVGEHKRMYDRQLQRERQRLLKLVDDPDENRFEILAALTRLRQLAIDPRLLDEGSTAPRSKIDALLELLSDALAENHRVLVFSQFTTFLGYVRDELEAQGIEHLYLDGATRNRQQVIDAFATGESKIFLISLKAGGVGLNLTMADYAVLTDPWWNPAAEEQAIDRAHRIGQTKPVHVYRMVSQGTIEEKVVALQESKRKLLTVISDEAQGETAVEGTELREDSGSETALISATRISAADLRELLE